MQHSISRRAASVLVTLAAFGALAATTAASAQAPAADTLAKVKQAGTLVVGNGGAYPPFEYVADGVLTGFDIDLGNELGKRMGVKVEWKVTEFAGLIASLTSGRVDALVTAFTKTPERAEKIAFSTSYYQTGIAAAYWETAPVKQPEDLAGKIVGVQGGTAGEKFVMEKWADKVKEKRVYAEFPLALRDLEIGRTQVVVNTLPVLAYNLSRHPNPKIKVSEAWDARDVGINTRLGDKSLLDEINKQLQAMRDDGFLAKLNAKWFGS